MPCQHLFDVYTPSTTRKEQLSLVDKLNFFSLPTSVRKSPDEDAQDSLSDDEIIEDDVEEDKYLAYFGSIRDILVFTEPFQHLLTKMRKILYYDDGTKMSEIRNLMLEELLQVGPENNSTQQSRGGKMDYPETNDSKNDKFFYSISFQIEWDLLVFLESWLGDSEPQLGSSIVLTGTTLYAQAATCADYLRRTWPQRFVLSPRAGRSAQIQCGHEAKERHVMLQVRFSLFLLSIALSTFI